MNNILSSNAVWRLAKGGELHLFKYNYDHKFGPYTLETYVTPYPERYGYKLKLEHALRLFNIETEAIGAFVCNGVSIVIIYPNREVVYTYNNDVYKMTPDAKAVVKMYDDYVQGWESQTPVGYKKTPIIYYSIPQRPYMMFMSEGGVLSDDIPDLYFAEPNPPKTLFMEMVKEGADYAYIDSRTQKAVFGKDK